MTQRARAELALFAVTLAWGGSFVVVKESLATFAPFTLVALRFAIASATLALVFRGRVLALPRAQLGAAVGIGALLFVAFAFQTVGLERTTPARSGFITATYVAMVPLLARVVLKRPLRRRVIAAVGAAVFGLYLLTHPGGAGANLGDALSLLCALGFAAHMLALGRWTLAMPAPALAFVQMATATALALPLALAAEPWPRAIAPASWSALVVLGVACSAGGFLGQTWGQRHTSPVRTGLIFSLESLFAALLSVALGAETLRPAQWLGGLLLVGGVVLGELPDEVPRAGEANA